MHIRFRIGAFAKKFPLSIEKRVNDFLHKKWPVWGYHTNSKSLLSNMKKFLDAKGTEWEYTEVKSYYHIHIFDKDTAEQFAKKFKFSFGQ